MAPRLFRVILQVGDVDAAERFYSDVLGICFVAAGTEFTG